MKNFFYNVTYLLYAGMTNGVWGFGQDGKIVFQLLKINKIICPSQYFDKVVSSTSNHETSKTYIGRVKEVLKIPEKSSVLFAGKSGK